MLYKKFFITLKNSKIPYVPTFTWSTFQLENNTEELNSSLCSPSMSRLLQKRHLISRISTKYFPHWHHILFPTFVVEFSVDIFFRFVVWFCFSTILDIIFWIFATFYKRFHVKIKGNWEKLRKGQNLFQIENL